MFSYESNTIIIETTRWDPVTGTSSALIGAGVDALNTSVGILTKPYQEWRKAQTAPRPAQPGESSSRSSSSHVSSPIPTPQDPDSASVTTEKKSGLTTAAAMAAASAKSLGMFYALGFRGMMVDVPLAATEGLRAVPGLYGEQLRDIGTVRDWKSGAVAAGKNFAYGMGEGLSDIFVLPYKGGREEGGLGVAKGVGKGGLSMVTKPFSGKHSVAVVDIGTRRG
jgi:hypothetical protein